MRLCFLALLCLVIPLAGAAELPSRKFADVMAEFQRAPEFQSVRSTIRSINLDFESRDLVLEPVLELAATRINESREFLSPASKRHTSTLSALLTKPFSTGTTLKVVPSFERAFLPALTPNEESTFDWQISISQDLWRDFLGRSTRLRRARESYEQKQQLSTALQSQAQLMVDFESLYWDWASALRERDLRHKNVSRGNELLKWMRERYARSAAESSDVVQAQALLANRQLQLLTVEQNLILLASRLQRFMPGAQWQPDPTELGISRSPEPLLTHWEADDLARAERLELISARNAALAAEQRASESRESIRPDLSLQLAYGKNAIDPSDDLALREGIRDKHEYSSIGVVFSSGLDLGLERKKVEAARAARDSSKLHLAALEAEGAVSWDQLKRNISDLKLRSVQAKQLTDLQWKKADAERKRYRLGRTTAFQVISFEQDAADAEISLINLFALTRKTEAQVRLYAQ